MTKHLKFGGSTIARTIQCPAWQRLSEDLPKGISSPYAEEGTMLHEQMERIIKNHDNAADAIQQLESFMGDL